MYWYTYYTNWLQNSNYNNVIITSKQRRDVILTSKYYFCIVCTLGCKHRSPNYNDVIMTTMTVSNHQPRGCLLNRLCRHRSKKTSKVRVTGLIVGTGEFPAQRASYAENVSIWWRHHDCGQNMLTTIILHNIEPFGVFRSETLVPHTRNTVWYKPAQTQ